jgi:dihydropteroate synthase
MAKVRLMGILNVTPDSFYKRSCFFEADAAIKRGIDIYEQGADIIDVGGESTRPGSEPVDLQEELRRVIPVIKALSKNVPIPISIDTKKAEVAEAALQAGAALINDVAGFTDLSMQKLAVQSQVSICLMHMQGTPKTMQHNPVYPEGVVAHLIDFFERQTALLVNSGVAKEKIIIDPGIGFGKTVADNVEIIDNLHKLKDLGFPILLGASRKSFLPKLLNNSKGELLAATVTANIIGIQNGADIIRVHDIQEHRDMITLLNKLRSVEKSGRGDCNTRTK